MGTPDASIEGKELDIRVIGNIFIAFLLVFRVKSRTFSNSLLLLVHLRLFKQIDRLEIQYIKRHLTFIFEV